MCKFYDDDSYEDELDEAENEAGKHPYEDDDDISDDEGGAAVLARHVGETPDVAQADSRSGCGEDDADAALEVVMG